MGNYSSNHHSFPVTMVTKEMTKASAERDRVTQVKRDRANARQLRPGQGQSQGGDRQYSKTAPEPLLADGCSCVRRVHTGVCKATQVLSPRYTKCHNQCSYHRPKKNNNPGCVRLSCHSFNPNALTIDFCTSFLHSTRYLPPALRTGSATSLASSPHFSSEHR